MKNRLPSFDRTDAEDATMMKIVERAAKLTLDLHGICMPASDRVSLHMDIAACHANGNPLRLDDLLAADDFNFLHDVFGIRRALDRTTGELTDFFSPRFSRREAA